MSEPRIVTPQKAQEVIYSSEQMGYRHPAADLLHTVATEPDRTRAAVVAELRRQARLFPALNIRADAIENGADL